MDFFELNNLVNKNAEVVNKYNEYSQKSEQELMCDLNRVASKMKSEGSFDISAIEGFYNNASVYLNSEQRNRMRTIIDMLKGDNGKV